MDNGELLQEITRRIDSSAKETREYVDTAVKASAQETRGYLDESAQVVRADFARAAVDLTSGYRAVAEKQDHHITIIAEGHETQVAKILRVAADLRQEMRDQGELLRTEMRAGDEKLRIEMRAGDAALREELTAFRAEVRGEFAEVRRVARLETTVSDLATRVGRLEDRPAS